MMTEQEYVETVKNMRNHTARLEHEGDYWTQEEKEKLAHLFGTGTDMTKIAVQLQRSEPAIMQQAEKMDLFQRKENPSRRRFAKVPSCLCRGCEAPDSCCPRCDARLNTQEGI